MRNLALLLIIFSSGTFACDVPLGEYDAYIESEFSVSIVLQENQRYQFVHKNWLPGTLKYVGEEHIYKGTYTCSGTSLVFKYTDSGEPVYASYETISIKKEIGFPKDLTTKAIRVKNSTTNKSMVSGMLFYPKGFMQNAVNSL